MDLTSPEMRAITDAIAILHQGDTQRARALLLRLWVETSPGGTPLQLCTLAHFLADTETDVTEELAWDLRALKAATGGDETRDRDAVSLEIASFLPSLHLNVGDCYRRLGDLERARRHVFFASNRTSALKDDGYGNLIRSGLRRLQERLSSD